MNPDTVVLPEKQTCTCKLCIRAGKYREFIAKLSPELHAELDKLWEDINMELEAESTDFAVLQSCIERQWPGSESGTFLHRVGNNLYEVTAKKVEENHE